MKDALKLALEALERVNTVDDDCDILAPELADAVVEAITAIKKALAQPDYRAVKTYHEGKPVYVSQPEQEPVGYEHHEHRPFGAPGEIRIHAILKSQFLHPDGSIGNDFQWLIDSYKADKNTIKLVPLYTAPPKRPWVGLTDEEIENGMCMSIQKTCRAIEATLKEKNT